MHTQLQSNKKVKDDLNGIEQKKIELSLTLIRSLLDDAMQDIGDDSRSFYMCSSSSTTMQILLRSKDIIVY